MVAHSTLAGSREFLEGGNLALIEEAAGEGGVGNSALALVGARR